MGHLLTFQRDHEINLQETNISPEKNDGWKMKFPVKDEVPWKKGNILIFGRVTLIEPPINRYIHDSWPWIHKAQPSDFKDLTGLLIAEYSFSFHGIMEI